GEAWWSSDQLWRVPLKMGLTLCWSLTAWEDWLRVLLCQAQERKSLGSSCWARRTTVHLLRCRSFAAHMTLYKRSQPLTLNTLRSSYRARFSTPFPASTRCCLLLKNLLLWICTTQLRGPSRAPSRDPIFSRQ